MTSDLLHGVSDFADSRTMSRRLDTQCEQVPVAIARSSDGVQRRATLRFVTRRAHLLQTRDLLLAHDSVVDGEHLDALLVRESVFVDADDRLCACTTTVTMQ